MLRFQQVLSIYKIEFWYEIIIAALIWENVDLWFSQKCTLTSEQPPIFLYYFLRFPKNVDSRC